MQTAFSNCGPAEGTRFLEMVFPAQSNHYGTLFGGTALNLMGKAAFIAASRHARRAVVIAASDRVDFLRPIKVGQLVELDARIVRAGRSSMTVKAETLLSGERQLVMTRRFEMVVVDAAGQPTPFDGTKSVPKPTTSPNTKA